MRLSSDRSLSCHRRTRFCALGDADLHTDLHERTALCRLHSDLHGLMPFARLYAVCTVLCHLHTELHGFVLFTRRHAVCLSDLAIWLDAVCAALCRLTAAEACDAVAASLRALLRETSNPEEPGGCTTLCRLHGFMPFEHICTVCTALCRLNTLAQVRHGVMSFALLRTCFVRMTNIQCEHAE